MCNGIKSLSLPLEDLLSLTMFAMVGMSGSDAHFLLRLRMAGMERPEELAEVALAEVALAVGSVAGLVA